MDTNSLAHKLTDWRHELHRHPETAFDEHYTSVFLADRLEEMGITVTRGIGGTGLVGTLKKGTRPNAVGLRTDIDANAITEQGNPPWKSQNPGRMHACGHDGHMVQLLGAAWLLSHTIDFDGTVYFICQPAEEPGKGARAMIDDGLFQRFPMDSIYGLHNMPMLPAGQIHVCPGGIMASEDNFTIQITGKGAHASSPHMAIDPLVTAAELILALQTIPSRTANPLDPVVVSCTELYMDGAHNAIPSHVTIKGDTRSFSPDVQTMIETRMHDLTEAVCTGNGATYDFSYTHEFAPTRNTPANTALVARAARRVLGSEQVYDTCEPIMISEDFAQYLDHVPGAFFFLGSGVSNIPPENTMLHNAGFDYNDHILMTGATVLAEIACQALED